MAALVKNGEVVAAIQEERLNNIKHFGGIPEKSIKEVFNISKIDPSEVNLTHWSDTFPYNMEL